MHGAVRVSLVRHYLCKVESRADRSPKYCCNSVVSNCLVLVTAIQVVTYPVGTGFHSGCS